MIERKKRKIGLAGYTGSGKSTAARLIQEEFSCRVIDADREAKKLMRCDTEIRQHLQQAFGTRVLTQQHTIDYAVLGEIVFSSYEMITRLNRIVHPPLLSRLYACIDEFTGQCIVLDAALIPLWNIDHWFDTRIWVDASLEKRVRRLQNKLSLQRDTIFPRCKLQEGLFSPPVGVPGERKWHIVDNNGSEYELFSQIRDVVRTS